MNIKVGRFPMKLEKFIEVGHPDGSWKDDSESFKCVILMMYWIKNGRQNDINP